MLEQFDTHAGVRNALRHISERTADWAGIPMPIDGERLVIEPRFPMAKELAEIGAPKDEEPLPADLKQRNRFWSRRLNGEVFIWEEGGKVLHAVLPHSLLRSSMELKTLMCSAAWGLEQEHRALQLLGRLISPRQFKQYALTGMFLETSQRSGLTYMFRKLRPTIAIDARPAKGRDTTRMLCALCAHPIAYYQETWAGAMTPTDDVVAHLMMMRADEHMFWKRSSQHQPWRPEAGL